MELLTFTEAAAFAGVSSKTIHKHVKQGKLVYVDTPFGKRIERERLLPYRNLLGTNGNEWEESALPEREEEGAVGSGCNPQGESEWEPVTPGDTVREQSGTVVSTVPLQAHLSALQFAKEQLERTQQWLDEERQRAQIAQQLVLQAERSKVALESQLSQYQRVLSEHAESLAEERALRLTLQARSEEATVSLDESRQAELLREENLRSKEIWEAEKAQLMGEISHHRDRVSWLEKKVPRWVRGMFGAK